MKTSVFGDNFCSLLTAQSQARGLPAGAPLPWVSSLCLSLCGKHRFQKGRPTWVQFWPSHKQATQHWQRTSHRLHFFSYKRWKLNPTVSWSGWVYVSHGVIYMKCRGLAPATWRCLINDTSLLRQTRSGQIRDNYYGVASLSILPQPHFEILLFCSKEREPDKRTPPYYYYFFTPPYFLLC